MEKQKNDSENQEKKKTTTRRTGETQKLLKH